MELEGIVGQANHAGKREILVEEEEEGDTVSGLVDSGPAGTKEEEP